MKEPPGQNPASCKSANLGSTRPEFELGSGKIAPWSLRRSEQSLKATNEVLEHKINESKRVEQQFAHSLSLLKAALESTADGILVVDGEENIISFNQRFVDMWNVPQEIVESRDDSRAVKFLGEQLKD